MTLCLDDEAILSFGRGNMAAGDSSSAAAHIAECDECRVLVSAIRRASFIDPGELVPSGNLAPATDRGVSEPAAPSAEVPLSRVDAVSPVLGAVNVDVVPVAPRSPFGRAMVVAMAAIGALVVFGIVLDTLFLRNDRATETATASERGADPASKTMPAVAVSAVDPKAMKLPRPVLSERK